MAGSLNKVELIGHLGGDPDVRSTAGGTRVCSLRLATTDSWRDKQSGERRERTEWHRITIFNDHLVEVADKYLKKGSKAFIEGALRTRKYTDKDSVERYSTEIVLEAYGGRLILLDRSERAPPPDEQSYGSTRTRDRLAGSHQAPLNQSLDDEIPF